MALSNVRLRIALTDESIEDWPEVKILEFTDTQVVFTTFQDNIRVYMKHFVRFVSIEKLDLETKEENTNHANES